MAIVAQSLSLEVHQLPAFEDNYLYVVFNRELKKAWMVDPGNYDVLESWRQRQGGDVMWEGALITHHHYDHVGALSSLRMSDPELQVYGSHEEKLKVSEINRTVNDCTSMDILGATVQVISLPGHTMGLIAYYFPIEGWIFVGDALFAMGCGRLFEGSYEDLFSSLAKLKTLPPQTLIFSAHEYSEKNSHFAIELEPQNELLKQRWVEIRKLRSLGQATVPFTLEIELKTNPFLRLESPEIRESLGLKGEADLAVLRSLRDRRNQF